jgi:phage-related protein (TIGR01555 family)
MSRRRSNRIQQRQPTHANDNTPKTQDSYQNFSARVGVGTDNVSSGATYGFNPVTRNRIQIEWMYRGSWLVGKAVDVVAEDMTRAGIDISGTTNPDDIERLHQTMSRLQIWQALNDTVKWSRLYGGAVAVMLIDGQDVATPLRPETVSKDQFKGLLVLDRWMVQPSLGTPVKDFGPYLGQPEFYTINQNAPALMNKRVHYSRIIRIDGYELPFQQRQTENGWGLSIVERLYDRLVAFDSSTQGAAQLVFKAHLRTYKVANLRKVIAAGGVALDALTKQMDMIRKYQSNEGLTLMDGEDEFEAHSYSFAGLSDLLLQFGQQLSGALDIPLVRLFGQSPSGMNSTGESDLRNYYDSIAAQQERRLRLPFTTLLNVLYRSEFGSEPPSGFNFRFNPLWQLSEKERAETAQVIATAVSGVFTDGIITRVAALKELRQSADVTGIFSNISDEDIEDAEGDMPPGTEGLLDDPEGDTPEGDQPDNDPVEQEQSEAEPATSIKTSGEK